jgi:hypothetical protein
MMDIVMEGSDHAMYHSKSMFADSFHLDDGGDRSPKRRFLQEPHGVTFQKTAFFIVIADKNLRSHTALTGWAL